MEEKILRQHSTQTVAWSLLEAFGQVYYKNQEQKAELKDCKNLQFGQKIACKVVTKEVVLIEEITTHKKMLSTLHKYNRKDSMTASQEFERPHALQAPQYKFEKLFKNQSWGPSAITGSLGSCSSMLSHLGTQGPMQPWYEGAQLLAKLEKYIGIIHIILVL